LELKIRPRIGVVGPSECSPEVWNLAREVGFLIAREGGILICGGRSGVMEAAASGAKQAGGVTVGILPGRTASEANSSIDIPIVTDMGHARNVINVLTSQVIIAVHGAYGTLSEIALALACGRPVVGLQTWSLTPPEGSLPPSVMLARTAAEAVASAFRLIRETPPQPL
jgi:uncharacterized protein (TIGR00725 family)